MKSTNRSIAVETLINQYRAQPNLSRLFPKFLKCFEPNLNKAAAQYDEFWQDDFIQEGKLGLSNAIQKFPSFLDATLFIGYAKTAIDRSMLDFYRFTVGKSLIRVEQFNEDGKPTTIRIPTFVNPHVISDEDSEDYFSTVPSRFDYATSIMLGLDLKYCLAPTQSSTYNLTEQETQLFQMHFIEGYNVSETADSMRISVGYASKVISRTRTKLYYLLEHVYNN